MTRLLLALVAALGIGFYATTPAAAITGSISLTISCFDDPEVISIFNATDEPLSLSGFTLSSIDDPQDDQDFALSGTVQPGSAIRFESGNAATGNVLTTRFIFDNQNPNEGVILTTPFGTLNVLCSAMTGTLVVGTTPAPTATSTTAPVAPTATTPGVPVATATTPDGTAVATATPDDDDGVVIPGTEVAVTKAPATQPPAPAPTEAPAATTAPVTGGGGTTGGGITLPDTGAGTSTGSTNWMALVAALLVCCAGSVGLAVRTRRA